MASMSSPMVTSIFYDCAIHGEKRPIKALPRGKRRVFMHVCTFLPTLKVVRQAFKPPFSVRVVQQDSTTWHHFHTFAKKCKI